MLKKIHRNYKFRVNNINSLFLKKKKKKCKTKLFESKITDIFYTSFFFFFILISFNINLTIRP